MSSQNIQHCISLLEDTLKYFSIGQTDQRQRELSPNPQWSNLSEGSCPTNKLSPISPTPKSAAWAQNKTQSRFTQLQLSVRLQFVTLILFHSNEKQLKWWTEENKSKFTVCDGKSDAVKTSIGSYVILYFILLQNCTPTLTQSADHRGNDIKLLSPCQPVNDALDETRQMLRLRVNTSYIMAACLGCFCLEWGSKKVPLFKKTWRNKKS